MSMEMDTYRKSGIEEISNYAVRLQDKGDKEARENIDKLMIFYVSLECKFARVGGNANNGSDSNNGIGYAHSFVGMLACKSKEIAEYASTQFGKLVFDACFARHFKGEEFEWLD